MEVNSFFQHLFSALKKSPRRSGNITLPGAAQVIIVKCRVTLLHIPTSVAD